MSARRSNTDFIHYSHTNMIHTFFSYLNAKIKKNYLPLIITLAGLLLNFSIAIMGPYFHRPHWSAAVFPPIIFAFLTLSLYYLGGILGALGIYLLFSFCILDLFLAYITGLLSDDLITATAASGGFHHFKFEILIWAGIGIIFTLFCKKFFKRNLKNAAGFFASALILFAINWPLSFRTKGIFLSLIFKPWPEIGIQHTEKIFLPMSTPNILTQLAYETRHANPGVIGDILSIIMCANDPGADMIKLSNHPIPATFSYNPENAVNNIVLIMGESSTSTHFHAYNYDIQTTPLLDRFLSQKNACKITKAHSPANQTRNAVLPSISLWRPENPALALTEINLIELARKQGYRTYWASTQSEHGTYSGFIGYIGKYADYFIDPNTMSVPFKGKKFRIGEKDEELIPFMERFSSDQDPSEKKLIILHLWGTHVPYWPKINREDKQSLPNASSYDQSIHRTDRIISEIVKTAQKNLKKPLIIYLSDHGEDPLSKAGHGIAYGGKDYEIPLILIGEKAKENCSYLETLRADNGWYSSNMNKFLMMHLLGVTADKKQIEDERNPDLIYNVDDKIYPWGNIPGQHLND